MNYIYRNYIFKGLSLPSEKRFYLEQQSCADGFTSYFQPLAEANGKGYRSDDLFGFILTNRGLNTTS